MHRKVRFHQLPSLSDGEQVMIIGHYIRHARGVCLYLGDQSLPLVGEPFTWLPPQNALTEIWGEFLQGDPPRLLVHDARPAGTEEPAVMVTKALNTEEEFLSLVRVKRIGNQQVAITPDRKSLILGDELGEGVYVIEGHVTTLDPPTLEIGVSVALPFVYVADPSEYPSGSNA